MTLRRGQMTFRKLIDAPNPIVIATLALSQIEPVFFGFDDAEDVYRNFAEDPDDSYRILYALYLYGSYEGRAFVLLHKDGTLYEVNGSHCSCNGLEGQWGLEETYVESLRTMVAASYMFGNNENEEERDALNALLDRIAKTTAPSTRK